MQITEIRIKLVHQRTDRLKAFCTVTFDNAFVVRDLKIIEGTDGYFVAMPSRKLTDRCPSCGAKNPLRSRFCNECGARQPEKRSRRGGGGRTKLHADVAHPVNSEARQYIQAEIVQAYEREVELAKQPGYRPADFGDEYEDDYSDQGYRSVASQEDTEAHSEKQPPAEEAAPENDKATDAEDDETPAADDDGEEGGEYRDAGGFAPRNPTFGEGIF